MSKSEPKLDYSELYLTNPKDVLSHKVRTMMFDLYLKGIHNIDFSPQYYTGTGLQLENSFLIDGASTIPVTDQILGNGDYDG